MFRGAVGWRAHCVEVTHDTSLQDQTSVKAIILAAHIEASEFGRVNHSAKVDVQDAETWLSRLVIFVCSRLSKVSGGGKSEMHLRRIYLSPKSRRWQ